MNHNKYIIFLLYRAYIERNPLLKQKLRLCGQQYLGLAFNLSGLSPIIQLIIRFLEPEYIIYLIIYDDYNFVKDPLFSHIIHLNNMIAELSPQLLCKFCMKAIIGRAGCEHYKLDCKLGYNRFDIRIRAQNIVKNYYPDGGSWVLDWDLYIHIGNILRDNLRKKSWELRRGNVDVDGNCGLCIKKYFFTYYYWWNDEDYETFLKTCSKIIF